MLTDDASPVDGPPPAGLPLALMMTISEIAERDGISKQAVSKRVAALVEEHALVVDRDGQGRVTKVDVAQYDHLRAKHGDPSKDQRPEHRPAEPAASDSYDETLRQKTWYYARAKGLALDEQIGSLVRVDELEGAADACGEAITLIVRSLQNETDALAATVARDGAQGLRFALKNIETRLLNEISAALAALAAKPGEAAASE